MIWVCTHVLGVDPYNLDTIKVSGKEGEVSSSQRVLRRSFVTNLRLLCGEGRGREG